MSTEKRVNNLNTPLNWLGKMGNNDLYIKREDLIPYSFGGNKARKGFLFFEDIDSGDYDCVVTYGSSHSNHCRIIANMAAKRKMPCYIIGPSEVSEITSNRQVIQMFGAEFTFVPVDKVHDTIENKLAELKAQGKKPYFIPGGGHGNIGTQAYVDCYKEIAEYEQANDIKFDYIFFASGTGTTHAGLVVGQMMEEAEAELAGNQADKVAESGLANNQAEKVAEAGFVGKTDKSDLGAGDVLHFRKNRDIVGISIARKNPRGRDVVLDSVKDYLKEYPLPSEFDKPTVAFGIEERTIFIDDYTGDGYGQNNEEIQDTIKTVMIEYGIPLDSTYTGKAFLGMTKYIEKEEIEGKNILFIHTGGTPLFFDDLDGLK